MMVRDIHINKRSQAREPYRSIYHIRYKYSYEMVTAANILER